jgi:hypothetical protein
MLRPIAISAVIAFGLYAALIEIWSPDVHAGQDQEADNAIAIERFLYEKQAFETAIVGSSQAQHIPAAALGPGVANLALAAESPLVGLTIIARSGRVPRRIYVETNQIAGPVDTGLISGFFTEPGHTLKRFVKALRTTYQPANLLVSLVRRATRGRDELYYPKLADPSLHDILIARELELLNIPPNAALLERNLVEMKRLVALLASKGSEIVFFEMPIEPQFEQTSGVIAVREAVRAAFPPGRACWSDNSPPTGLPTTDGVHIDSDGAARFGQSLLQTVCQPTLAAEPSQRH